MTDEELIAELRVDNIINVKGQVNSYRMRDASYQQTASFTQLVERTSFLPADETSVVQRVWCARTNITSLPVCKNCDQFTGAKFNSTTGFPTYCSARCSNRDPDKKETIRQVNDQRYGGHPMSTDAVRNKVKATNLARYGSEEILSLESTQSKIAATNTERYGNIRAIMAGESKEKRKATMISQYGVEYLMESSEFQEANKAHILEKYGVTSTAKLEATKEKARSNRPAKYKYADTYSNLSDPSWLYEQHITLKKTPTRIAYELGLKDEKSITTRLRQHGIEVIHYEPNVSCAETELGDFIEQYVDIIRSDRTLIKPKELDIVIPALGIAIEYCGLYWHSDLYKSPSYHADKWTACNNIGIRLITIFEDEWLLNKDLVKLKLLHLIGKNNCIPNYARNCNVVTVDTQTKTEFFDRCHVQKDGPSSINLGLTHNGMLVACMGFINKSNGVYVLNRYATVGNVPGGFSRLLNQFTKTTEWNTIETFADLRWSNGELYEKRGFTESHHIPADYHWSDGTNRMHKFGFRRRLLPAKLSEYNPTESEAENCRRHGLVKIYDCGKIKYVLTNNESNDA